MEYKYLNDKNLKFLKRFLSTYSPSGYEMEAASVWREYVSQFVPAKTDVLCNTVGVINPDAEFKIMLCGHLDEIGLQVMYISAEGLVYFRKLGGIDALTVPGTEVMILTRKGRIPGVIGKKPIHLQSASDRQKAVELDDLWVDIGVETKEEAEALVSIGDPIAVKENCLFMGENRIMSKALDDKIGAFIVAEVLRVLSSEDIKVGVYGVASSQEEVGCRGAVTSSYSINPQVGFCLDVGFATDIPGIEKKKYGEMALGGGAVIRHSADNNVLLVRLLQDVAAEKEIKVQNVANGSATGGTDTCKIQLAQSGVATALLSIPNRYMHTPVEVCDLRDVDEIIALLVEAIKKIDAEKVFNFVPERVSYPF